MDAPVVICVTWVTTEGKLATTVFDSLQEAKEWQRHLLEQGLKADYWKM